jgi:hypothetical protein
MSNLVAGVSFSLSTTQDFSKLDMASKLVNAICDSPANLKPVRYGSFSGDNIIGSTQDVVRVLVGHEGQTQTGGVILSVNKDCEYQLQWDTKNNLLSYLGGFLLSGAYRRNSQALNDFLALFKKMAVASDVAYGDFRSMNHDGWDTPFNLMLRLPDIPNVSIYGKPYVEMFGRDTIENSPFHKIEEIADDIYWLQSTEDVIEIVPDSIRAKIRNYFGERAYMEGKKWRYKDGLHPEWSKYMY